MWTSLGVIYPTKSIFFAHKNDTPVAVLSLEVLNGVGFVSSIIVQEDCRGKGIGSKLMDQCEQYAKEKGYFYLWLETRREWEAAYCLYINLGYQVTSELPCYYFGLPWVIMGKKL